MHKLVPFAIASCRRQAEIVKLQWKDLNAEEKTIIVREMKHTQKNNPNRNIKIDVECKLTDEALSIILSMPRVSEFVFPFSESTVSTAFTEACKILGIEDLHFHDMRHEAVSRLFEMGRGIPEVQRYSGHRSWAGLERSAQIRHKGDIYQGWSWWDAAFAPMDEAQGRSILVRREIASAAAAKAREKRPQRALAAAA